MIRLIYAPHHRLENQHTRRGPLPGTSHLKRVVSRSSLRGTCEFTRKGHTSKRSNGPTRTTKILPVCATLYNLYSTMSHLSTHGGARFSFLLRSVSLALGLGSRARHSRHTHLVVHLVVLRLPETQVTLDRHIVKEKSRRDVVRAEGAASPRLLDYTTWSLQDVVVTRRGRPFSAGHLGGRGPPRRRRTACDLCSRSRRTHTR